MAPARWGRGRSLPPAAGGVRAGKSLGLSGAPGAEGGRREASRGAVRLAGVGRHAAAAATWWSPGLRTPPGELAPEGKGFAGIRRGAWPRVLGRDRGHVCVRVFI